MTTPTAADEMACVNTDRELWRETDGDYYAPSIFVTEHGWIGMNVGGNCFVMSIRTWHGLAAQFANQTPLTDNEIASTPRGLG